MESSLFRNQDDSSYLNNIRGNTAWHHLILSRWSELTYMLSMVVNSAWIHQDGICVKQSVTCVYLLLQFIDGKYNVLSNDLVNAFPDYTGQLINISNFIINTFHFNVITTLSSGLIK